MKDNMIQDNELLVEELVSVPAEEEVLKFRRPRRVIRKKRALIVLLIILGIVGLAALSFAGYMIFKPEEGYDDSAAFYFSSDILSEDGAEYSVYDTIDFVVRNYADDLRISKEPIESFTVTVKSDGKDITPKTLISMDESSFEVGKKGSCSVSVTVPEKYIETLIEVSVVSAPIAKELKASFRIEPAWEYYINDEKGNYCAELVILANKDVALELSWDDEKLIPSSVDPYIAAGEPGENKCDIRLSKNMSITIPMFKADPSKSFAADTKSVLIEAVELPAEGDNEPSGTDISEETEEVSE